MSRRLNWVKEAFSRDLSIIQDGQVIGGMHRGVFSQDVEAHLNTTRLKFDVTGFLIHSVNIHDLNANDQIIGQIEFHFGKRAELKLASGEIFLWKRHNVLMREWDMIQEKTDGSSEKELINYDLTRQFFEDHGDITVHEDQLTPALEIVILTGLFIRNYFQRRRRMAAAAAAGVASR
ncbi:hypothetical protein [Spirosoma sp. KNUC1025]|uniref:hypothetical protein n=1 Tax=Spirosoma sp. KNUC1025 TaxID=2894082 RepID=UPI003868CF56|nr:hypothetical protein LN737_02960 [Spirosoma sp. KNUC1025]